MVLWPQSFSLSLLSKPRHYQGHKTQNCYCEYRHSFFVNCIISPRLVLENMRILIRLTAPPAAPYQASLYLVSWYDSWPGTDRGRQAKGVRKLEAPQRVSSRKDSLLENNCYFRSSVYQHGQHLEGRHLKEGKSYVISAQLNVRNCWFDRWWWL